MTTKQAGGKITGILALTMEATVALDVGDHVHVNGDYTVGLADGTKAILGRCSVSNKKSVNTPFSRTVGVPNVPGDVTIEARGIAVETAKSGDAFAAGVPVGIDATNRLVEVEKGDVNCVGLSLMAATDADEDVDYLVTAA